MVLWLFGCSPPAHLDEQHAPPLVVSLHLCHVAGLFEDPALLLWRKNRHDGIETIDGDRETRLADVLAAEDNRLLEYVDRGEKPGQVNKRVFSDIVIRINDELWVEQARLGGEGIHFLASQIARLLKDDLGKHLRPDRSPSVQVLPDASLDRIEVLLQFGHGVFVPRESDQLIGGIAFRWEHESRWHPLPGVSTWDRCRQPGRPAALYRQQTLLVISGTARTSATPAPIWFSGDQAGRLIVAPRLDTQFIIGTEGPLTCDGLRPSGPWTQAILTPSAGADAGRRRMLVRWTTSRDAWDAWTADGMRSPTPGRGDGGDDRPGAAPMPPTSAPNGAPIPDAEVWSPPAPALPPLPITLALTDARPFSQPAPGVAAGRTPPSGGRRVRLAGLLLPRLNPPHPAGRGYSQWMIGIDRAGRLAPRPSAGGPDGIGGDGGRRARENVIVLSATRDQPGLLWQTPEADRLTPLPVPIPGRIDYSGYAPLEVLAAPFAPSCFGMLAIAEGPGMPFGPPNQLMIGRLHCSLAAWWAIIREAGREAGSGGWQSFDEPGLSRMHAAFLATERGLVVVQQSSSSPLRVLRGGAGGPVQTLPVLTRSPEEREREDTLLQAERRYTIRRGPAAAVETGDLIICGPLVLYVEHV